MYGLNINHQIQNAQNIVKCLPYWINKKKRIKSVNYLLTYKTWLKNDTTYNLQYAIYKYAVYIQYTIYNIQIYNIQENIQYKFHQCVNTIYKTFQYLIRHLFFLV